MVKNHTQRIEVFAIKYITIATRKSPLALWQANFVAKKLQSIYKNLEVKLLPLITTGDLYTNNNKVAGKGLFLKELEKALFDKKAHIAVHSMKDVPSVLETGLELNTICARENPFDVFISNKYASIYDLPKKAIIGTSSVRRQAQLLSWCCDLKFKVIRGNIETRIKKIELENLDGIILAAAGIERLGLQVNAEILPLDLIVPACGQGAIGIECLAEDIEVKSILQPLQDNLGSACVYAERMVHKFLKGDCSTPIGIFCQPLPSNEFIFTCKIKALDGTNKINYQEKGLVPMDLAKNCIDYLLENGYQ